MKAVTIISLALLITPTAFAESQTIVVNQGRYVWQQQNNNTAEKYVLDTQTGKVWHLREAISPNSADMLYPVLFWCEGDKKGFGPNCQRAGEKE